MMWNKFLHSEAKSVEAGAFVLAGSGIMGGVLGMIRNALLASHFGAGRDLDIYFATFRIPDLIYNIFIFGALSAGFMPVFAKRIAQGKEKAWEFVSALMVIFLALTGLAAVVVMIFARPLARLLVPGFSPEEIDVVAGLLRVLMIQPIVLSLSNVVANTLQSFRRFFAYSLAPITYNIGIILGIVWLAKPWGIKGVIWGVVIGAILHLFVQLPAFFALDFRFVPRIRRAMGSLWEMGALMFPRSLALMIYQLNAVFLTIIASGLAGGTLAIFSFANDLQGLPQTLLALSFATAAFPALSQLWAQGAKEEFARLFRKTLAEIFVWLIPIALMLLAFHDPIVRVTLSYGRFDDFAHAKTSAAFAVFLFGLPAQGALLLLVRALFAMGESRVPLLTAVLSSAITVTVAMLAGKYWGAAGLASGVAAASIANAVFLFFIVRNRLPAIPWRPLFSIAARSFLVGLAAAASGWWTYYVTGIFIEDPSFTMLLLRLGLAAIPVATIFFIGIFMFKIVDINRLDNQTLNPQS